MSVSGIQAWNRTTSPLNEPAVVAADAATILFNLPDYRVISATITASRRQVVVETDELPAAS